MKRIDNIIFAILIGCFFICGFWMYQLFQYKLPETASEKTTPQGKTALTPESPPSQPLFDLPGDRNIFKSPWKEEDGKVVEETTTLQKPHLSTICWSDELPLAVIDGEILTKGDEDSKFQFRVETIARDGVGIRFISDGEYVWLTSGDEGEDLSFLKENIKSQVPSHLPEELRQKLRQSTQYKNFRP